MKASTARSCDATASKLCSGRNDAGCELDVTATVGGGPCEAWGRLAFRASWFRSDPGAGCAAEGRREHRFGSGYKNRPKSAASIRVIPLADSVLEAIARRMPPDGDPAALVFTGPGGSNGLPRGARSAMSRHGLLRVYKHALLRVADPAASLAYTPRRVLTGLRVGGPQTAEQVRGRLRGRTPRLATVLAALDSLQAAGLAAQDPQGRWAAHDPPSRDDLLGKLRLRGPHDLRHTFATWLEDAGIPARVIDELMGHTGGRRGAHSREGSMIGARYRWTTPEMEARVVAAVEQRMLIAVRIAEGWN